MSNNKKTIELWDGYEVEFNEQLSNDFDFVQDLSTAIKENDLAELTALYFALVGGEKVYNDTREHFIEKDGFFPFEAVQGIMKKIDECLPKTGNRAQRRSWQTTK